MNKTDHTKNRDELRCSRSVSNSCLLQDIQHVTHIGKTCWTPLCINKQITQIRHQPIVTYKLIYIIETKCINDYHKIKSGCV